MTATTPHRPAVIAMDVGGTMIKASIVEQDGARTHPTSMPTPTLVGGDQTGVIEAVLDTIHRLRETEPDVVGVGVVVPGVVDAHRGVAVYSENIGWHDIPFRSLVHDATGLPVGFGHDVRTAGLAEHRHGSGVGVDEFLFLPIGTGISAAMFAGGALIGGPLAGEIGHVNVGTGRPCACGATGCLETIASTRAITRAYNWRTRGAVEGAVDVAAAARGGDRDAQAVWTEAVEALADALAIYVTLLAPQRVAVGGGLSRAGNQLIAPLRNALARRLVWQHHPEIVTAALGSHAGQVGAALLAFAAAGHPLGETDAHAGTG